MSAIRTKQETLLLEIGGRQAEVPVVIKWILDPGSLGSHDEPPCGPFAEILTIRLAEIDIAPMLPKSSRRTTENDRPPYKPAQEMAFFPAHQHHGIAANLPLRALQQARVHAAIERHAALEAAYDNPGLSVE